MYCQFHKAYLVGVYLHLIVQWSGAFGQDPARLADQKLQEREREAEYNGKTIDGQNKDVSEDGDESSGSDTDASDLGVHDATNHEKFEEDQTNDGAQSAVSNQTDAEATANTGTATSRESHTRVAGKGLLSRAKDPVRQIKNW